MRLFSLHQLLLALATCCAWLLQPPAAGHAQAVELDAAEPGAPLAPLDAGAEVDSQASDADSDAASAEAPPQDAQASPNGSLSDGPPRVLYVPQLHVAQQAPASAVEATLRVNRDGSAELLTCDSSAEACAALRHVLPQARFEPARLGGAPVDAQVRVRFTIRPPELTATSSGEPTQPVAAQALDAHTAALDAGAPADAQAQRPSEYGAIARVSETAPTAVALELAEMRAVPGTFGDPFRVLDALPGVVPVMSGIPYVYVRGAPPASTVYFYDDIQVPALFHLGLGPAVVHAAMVGPIDFYPGVAPARYGRKTGGVMAGQASERPLRLGVHGELELRPIDFQAYLSKAFESGARVEAAARYGYPGLLLKAIEPKSVVQYWDYQLRGSVPVSRRSAVSWTILGSYDLIGEREDGKVSRDVELQFHRLELRSTTRFTRATLGAALGSGIERSGLGDDFELQSLRIGPRVWLMLDVAKAKLRFGADALLTYGRLDDPRAEEGGETFTYFDPETGATRTYTADNKTLPSNPLYASARYRYTTGAYAELFWPFAQGWSLEAGLRGDIWVTGGDPQPALEPRLVLRHQLHPAVGLHAAFGLGYQPAVFMIPLPGLSDVALDRGLQRVIQQELGSKVDLPASFSIESKVYLHLYDRILSLESIEVEERECTASQMGLVCDPYQPFGRMSAYSYGTELLVRRAFQERLSGWLSYTLAWADGRTDRGEELRPNFDVRHVANLILLWRITDKWRFSLRAYGQSGRFPLGATTEVDARARRRLPAFWRGDLQLARTWRKRWGELTFSFDWLNFTFQKEALGWQDCPQDRDADCKVEYLDFPITLPMLSVRASY